MPDVSIITPLYNAELYIDETVLSIIAQTHHSWELLLVNDASTDNSLVKCHEWSKKDNRIKVINREKKSGPAAARNAGMDNATGDYLSFIDSDDTIEQSFVETLLKTAKQFDADIVWCNYDEYGVDGTKKITPHNLPCNRFLDTKFLLGLYFNRVQGLGSLCNKLYRHSFIEENHFRINTDRVRAEDWEFNLFVFQKVKKVVAIPDSLYKYIRQNSSSVMASYRRQDFELMCRSQELLLDIQNRYGIEIDYAKFWGGFIYNVLYYMRIMVRNEQNNSKDRLKEIIRHPMFCKAIKSGSTKLLTTYQRLIFLSVKLKFMPLTWLLLNK